MIKINVLVIIFIGVICIGNIVRADTLTITKVGTGDGFIYSRAQTAPSIKCGIGCSSATTELRAGDQVSLLSKGDDMTWSGDCTSGGAIIMDGDKTCIATYTTALTMPNIDFDQSGWNTSAGVSNSAGVLTLVGDPNGIVWAEKEMPVTNDMLGRTVYLMGEVQADNIISSSSHVTAPKFIIVNTTNGSNDIYGTSYAFEDGSIIGWQPGALKYNVVGDTTNLKIRIASQNVAGTFKVRNLRLSIVPLDDSPTYPFNTPASVDATVNIGTSTKQFNNLLFGMNSHFGKYNNDFTGYDDQFVKNAIIDLNAPLFRFPGGTAANWYDWITDNYVSPVPVDIAMNSGFMNNYNDRIANDDPALPGEKDFNYPDLRDAMLSSDTPMSLVFNVLEKTPTDSVNRLASRINDGLNIKFVEIGNENYFPSQQSGSVHSVSDYITQSKNHITALKAINDDISYTVNVHNPEDPWTVAMSNDQNYFDAITAHIYNNLPFNGASLDYNTAKDMLLSYQVAENNLDGLIMRFPTKPILISEWGILDRRDGAMVVNTAAAIGSAEMMMAIIDKIDNVAGAGQHVFFSGFMGLYNKINPTNTEFVRTPYYYQMKLMMDTLMDNVIVQSATSSTNTSDGEPFVRTIVAKKMDGTIKIFAINKANIAATLNATEFSAGYTMKTYSESDIFKKRFYYQDENPIITTTGSGAVILPALSLSTIEINNIIQTNADVDQSGAVNTTDALLTLRNALGLNMDSTNWFTSTNTGNVNCDGISNAIDTLLILRSSLGLDMSGTEWCVD